MEASRSKAELDSLLADHVQLRELYEGLSTLPGVKVLAKGRGKSVFKAYLQDRAGPHEYFISLWINETYVNWSRQPSVALCRETFSGIVKSPDSPEGARINPDVAIETVLDVARQYLDSLYSLPTEQSFSESYLEGAVRQVLVNTYERSPQARDRALAELGHACKVCGLDFAEKFGESFRRCIHVHHLKELSLIGSEYKVDPINDLVPLCPNCHAMVHATKPAMSIDDLRRVIEKAGGYC